MPMVSGKEASEITKDTKVFSKYHVKNQVKHDSAKSRHYYSHNICIKLYSLLGKQYGLYSRAGQEYFVLKYICT